RGSTHCRLKPASPDLEKDRAGLGYYAKLRRLGERNESAAGENRWGLDRVGRRQRDRRDGTTSSDPCRMGRNGPLLRSELAERCGRGILRRLCQPDPLAGLSQFPFAVEI